MTNILKSADAKARRNFTYKSDSGPDTWRSHADVALAGKSWRGDCDDLASTSADIAIRMGAKKADLWFAVVSSTGESRGDHMIAIGRDEQGMFWVVGDTFGPTYKLTAMKHRLIDVHNLSWPIANWERYSSVDEFLASN